MTTPSFVGEEPLMRRTCESAQATRLTRSVGTDNGVLTPRMREFRYGNETLQILSSEFVGGLWEHVSHGTRSRAVHHSHLENLLGQPLLTFSARLTGE